ncbi:MAG: hypothetical protein ACTJGH_01890 [Peptoniphilaceae bacterium]
MIALEIFFGLQTVIFLYLSYLSLVKIDFSIYFSPIFLIISLLSGFLSHFIHTKKSSIIKIKNPKNKYFSTNLKENNNNKDINEAEFKKNKELYSYYRKKICQGENLTPNEIRTFSELSIKNRKKK